MIKILSIWPNFYQHWLTYEGEYINEALHLHPDVELKTWGRSRPGYVGGLDYPAIKERLYGSDHPDVILVDSSSYKSHHEHDRKIFEGMEDYRNKSLIIFTTADPWRFIEEFKYFHDKIQPHYWTCFSLRYTQIFKEILKGSSSSVHFVPLCLGRRYYNMGLEREHDLALIGRCQINLSEPVKPRSFWFKLKVYHEGSLSLVRKKMKPDQYMKRVPNLIMNLNQCFASWASPVKIKNDPGLSVPFRYLETPACGTILMTSQEFPEINDYYYPKGTYLCCDNNFESCVKQIKALRADSDRYLEMQKKAYKIVMGNHQGEHRVRFLLDLIDGRANEKTDIRDYYNINIHSPSLVHS